MNWLTAIFEAIKEGFSFFKQERDPEAIRLRKIADIDKQIEKADLRLEELLKKDVNDKNAEQNATDLGDVVNKLIELRKKRADIKK